VLKYGLLYTLIIAAWSNTLFAPFVFDDDHFIYQNPSVNFKTPVHVLQPRPLTVTTFRVNYWLGGTEPFGYHAVNLGLHLLNVSLVLCFLTPYLGSFAFAAAGIFGLHPLQSEAVTYVSARTDLLMTMMVLMALLASRWRWWAGIPFCLLAILAKESGVIALPLVILFAWMEQRIRARSAVVVLILALLLGGVLYHQANFTPSGRPFLTHALIQNAQLWSYLMMLVYPVGLSIDHDPEMIPAGLVCVALGCSGLVFWFSSPPYSQWLFWVFLTLLPRFLVNIPEYLAEHHLYLPFVGISAACALFFKQAFEWLKHYEHTPRIKRPIEG
jgi:protein O-mannosyl-transferase